ncbi:hypothetical protein SAMN05421693_11231 [Ectothiorhodospira magna]|uniref:Uncharacterized protein n=1 Tax=Ectothiorhodospira magna TaxID=867345 RepID=A0A1H9C3T5_9GAMM|nr:hypothetical protein [Ectothiorhodospira magna]SEP95792.1 hypothetical protein SAMN05421693_11231 [Ectothiorhodospira magna]
MVWNKIASGIQQAGNQISGGLKQAGSAAGNTLAGAGKAIHQGGEALYDGINSNVTTFVRDVRQADGWHDLPQGSKDAVHLSFSVVGLVPIVGIPFNLANMSLYAMDGDYVNAGLSGISVIPGGELARTGQVARAAAKVPRLANASGSIWKAYEILSSSHTIYQAVDGNYRPDRTCPDRSSGPIREYEDCRDIITPRPSFVVDQLRDLLDEADGRLQNGPLTQEEAQTIFAETQEAVIGLLGDLRPTMTQRTYEFYESHFLAQLDRMESRIERQFAPEPVRSESAIFRQLGGGLRWVIDRFNDSDGSKEDMDQAVARFKERVGSALDELEANNHVSAEERQMVEEHIFGYLDAFRDTAQGQLGVGGAESDGSVVSRFSHSLTQMSRHLNAGFMNLSSWQHQVDRIQSAVEDTRTRIAYSARGGVHNLQSISHRDFQDWGTPHELSSLQESAGVYLDRAQAILTDTLDRYAGEGFGHVAPLQEAVDSGFTMIQDKLESVMDELDVDTMSSVAASIHNVIHSMGTQVTEALLSGDPEAMEHAIAAIGEAVSRFTARVDQIMVGAARQRASEPAQVGETVPEPDSEPLQQLVGTMPSGPRRMDVEAEANRLVEEAFSRAGTVTVDGEVMDGLAIGGSVGSQLEDLFRGQIRDMLSNNADLYDVYQDDRREVHQTVGQVMAAVRQGVQELIETHGHGEQVQGLVEQVLQDVIRDLEMAIRDYTFHPDFIRSLETIATDASGQLQSISEQLSGGPRRINPGPGSPHTMPADGHLPTGATNPAGQIDPVPSPGGGMGGPLPTPMTPAAQEGLFMAGNPPSGQPELAPLTPAAQDGLFMAGNPPSGQPEFAPFQPINLPENPSIGGSKNPFRQPLEGALPRGNHPSVWDAFKEALNHPDRPNLLDVRG